MTPHHVKTIRHLGATAVQLGTAFLCCTESHIHPQYKEILLNTTTDTTILTKAFSGKLARGLSNTFTRRMVSQTQTLLDYPIQHALTLPMRQFAAQQNNTEFMALWAGQNVANSQKLSAKNHLSAHKKPITYHLHDHDPTIHIQIEFI